MWQANKFRILFLKYAFVALSPATDKITTTIQVNVFDQEILLEPDEERNYRIVNSQAFESGKPLDIDLLKAIINAIESIVSWIVMLTLQINTAVIAIIVLF